MLIYLWLKHICMRSSIFHSEKSPPFLSMWSNLPFDVLSLIFSFLSPDSLARARSSCKNWHTCANSYPSISPTSWFLALPIRNYHKSCCYAHNPITNNWHQLSLEFLQNPSSIRPTASIDSLILLRVTFTNSTTTQLALCNPFTRQFKYLPKFHVSRTNPAFGVVKVNVFNYHFRIYVVGGMSEAKKCGGATYEQAVEMYDSWLDMWQIVGYVPMEFAVRLTVWTPNENVCIEGKGTTLYWVTSARAYSVMGFDVGANSWREISVPLVERLEFATLVKRNGVLGLVGGTCGGSVCVWEMSEGSDDEWCLVDEVPGELGLRLLCGKRNWEGVKCVGNEDVICLYREVGFGMVVCRKVGGVGRWEWVWVDGCGFVKGKQVLNCSVRGTLVQPSLACSPIF